METKRCKKLAQSIRVRWKLVGKSFVWFAALSMPAICPPIIIQHIQRVNQAVLVALGRVRSSYQCFLVVALLYDADHGQNMKIQTEQLYRDH
jgi:hypothetical protein